MEKNDPAAYAAMVKRNAHKIVDRAWGWRPRKTLYKERVYQLSL